MEKIKVNMSPNPLDVQTIHASQNDGEARQWEFELHNNGELIDTSDVKEQLVFKAYKGGTEQILPENTSTPTTSPFIGDIKYPQGLLSDQEFTYRQSPTEEDGLAKITDIKGNTLNWNQLVENGDFASTSRWSVNNITTYSVANNTLTFSFSSNDGFIGPAGIPLTKNHKYLWLMDFKTDLPSPYRENIKIQNYRNGGWSIANRVSNNNWNTYSTIFTFTEDSATVTAPFFRLVSYTDGAIAISNSNQIRNVQVFDLTQMGLDITDPSDFTSLFPLPYYSYNQGSLLSFNGTGIKTVGKNQFNYDDLEVGTIDPNNGNNITNNAQRRTADYIHAIDNKQYTVSNINGRIRLFEYDANKNYITSFLISNNETFTLASNCAYFRLGGTEAYYSENTQIESGSTVTTYEPYTESVLSLPISTYFPTGMKSAGSVYDELTESKATTRVGRATINDFVYQGGTTAGGLYWADFDSSLVKLNGKAICNLLPVSNASAWSSTTPVIQIGTNINRVRIYGTFTSQAELESQYPSLEVYYELATPTETEFTTASLVTENAVIPLSNNDGTLIGKCTEQLSENPGFFDAKIKLSDADGECYSNKIQLHVERSPQ